MGTVKDMFGRGFGRFIAGFAMTSISEGMLPVAIVFALFKAGYSVGALSAVMAASAIPMVLFLLVGGVVGDKFSRRNVMIFTSIMNFICLILLAFMFFEHVTPLWAIALLAALSGLLEAFAMPCFQGFIPEIVPSQHLQSANGMVSMTRGVGNVIGPAISGLLIALINASFVIALGGITFLLTSMILFTLPKSTDEALSKIEKSENTLTSLISGWSEFTKHKWLWVSTLQSTILMPVVMAPMFVLGSLRFAHVGHGALGWGGLLSFMGGGAILGSVIAMQVKPRFPLRLGVLTSFGLLLLPASLASPLPYAAIAGCFFVGGISLPFFQILFTTLLQTKIQSDKISRVSSYDKIGSMCLMPVGFALVAPMVDLFSAHDVLWFSVFVVVVTCTLVLMVKDVRLLRAEGATES